jgi:hypothetical protein
MWVLMCLFGIVATLLHLAIVRLAGLQTLDGGGASGMSPDTRVFGLVGAMFLGVAACSHFIVKRAASRNGRKGDSAAKGTEKSAGLGPIGAILIPMAVRFAGTFAVLGGLLFFATVSRNESVFDVLFWYVTLTTMEIVGIVCTSRSAVPDEQSTSMSPASSS